MTDNDILTAGYKEYNPPPVESEGVTKCFQKCIYDERGKKYFIDIKRWDFPPHPYTGEQIPTSYEIEAQLSTKKDDVVNLSLFSNWDIKKAEEWIDTVWTVMNMKYYEKYNEED